MDIKKAFRQLRRDFSGARTHTIDMQDPKNSDETRMLGRASALIDQALFTAGAMKELDNEIVDFNPNMGEVAVDGERLGEKSTNQSGILDYDVTTGKPQLMEVRKQKNVELELSLRRNYTRPMVTKTTIAAGRNSVRYKIQDEVQGVLSRSYDIIVDNKKNTLRFSEEKIDHVWVGTNHTYGLS